MFWPQHLGCWGQNTSRIQNEGVYATLCLQAPESFLERLALEKSRIQTAVMTGRKRLEQIQRDRAASVEAMYLEERRLQIMRAEHVISQQQAAKEGFNAQGMKKSQQTLLSHVGENEAKISKICTRKEMIVLRIRLEKEKIKNIQIKKRRSIAAMSSETKNMQRTRHQRVHLLEAVRAEIGVLRMIKQQKIQAGVTDQADEDDAKIYSDIAKIEARVHVLSENEDGLLKSLQQPPENEVGQPALDPKVVQLIESHDSYQAEVEEKLAIMRQEHAVAVAQLVDAEAGLSLLKVAETNEGGSNTNLSEAMSDDDGATEQPGTSARSGSHTPNSIPLSSASVDDDAFSNTALEEALRVIDESQKVLDAATTPSPERDTGDKAAAAGSSVATRTADPANTMGAADFSGMENGTNASPGFFGADDYEAASEHGSDSEAPDRVGDANARAAVEGQNTAAATNAFVEGDELSRMFSRYGGAEAPENSTLAGPKQSLPLDRDSLSKLGGTQKSMKNLLGAESGSRKKKEKGMPHFQSSSAFLTMFMDDNADSDRNSWHTEASRPASPANVEFDGKSEHQSDANRISKLFDFTDMESHGDAVSVAGALDEAPGRLASTHEPLQDGHDAAEALRVHAAEQEQQNRAATKIQASFRGHKARKSFSEENVGPAATDEPPQADETGMTDYGTMQPDAGDVPGQKVCGYANDSTHHGAANAGRACQKILDARESSLFCTNHRCPATDCTESKSSKEKHCPTHSNSQILHQKGSFTHVRLQRALLQRVLLSFSWFSAPSAHSACKNENSV